MLDLNNATTIVVAVPETLDTSPSRQHVTSTLVRLVTTALASAHVWVRSAARCLYLLVLLEPKLGVLLHEFACQLTVHSVWLVDGCFGLGVGFDCQSREPLAINF